MVLPKRASLAEIARASLAEIARPLRWVELPDTEPAAGEILIRVAAGGVCRTELEKIEGRTPPPRLPVVPGHEVVGRVERFGDRVGVGWIYGSTGASDENLSPQFRATGRNANGGYAEWMTVSQDYAYTIPGSFSDTQAAPLLCAGAVGYRALKSTNLGG